MNKRKTKTQSGITLVALIITIIVLIILAIVSIRAIQQGGIITKAGTAKEAYSEAEEKEKIELAKMEALMDAYPKDSGVIQEEKLRAALAKQFKDGEFELTVDATTGDFLITMTSGRKYAMAKNGGAVTVVGGSGSGEGGSDPVTPSTPGDWTQNGDTITNSKTGETKKVGDTMTNDQVLAAIPDDQKTGTGTYSGTWTIIGTENGKLKLVSTNNVSPSVTLGSEDPKAIELYPLDEDNASMDDWYEVTQNRINWSYNNAVTTLCNKAAKATGISSARSINRADIESLIGFDKGIEYEREYRYYYDSNKDIYVFSQYKEGENWIEEYNTHNTHFSTMDKTLKEGESIILINQYYEYSFTSDQKKKYSCLAKGDYWLATPIVHCNRYMAMWDVLYIYEGTDAFETFKLSHKEPNGGELSVVHPVKAIVNI